MDEADGTEDHLRWRVTHAARAAVVALGGTTAVLLDEAGDAVGLWLPLAAFVAVTAAIDRRRPVLALWALDLVVVLGLRAMDDHPYGTEPLLALIAVTVAAGALGRARGVVATVVAGALSFLLGMPERWDRPWTEFPASLAVLTSLAVAGHVVGAIEHRSRQAGRQAEERSNQLQAVLSAVLHSDHRGIVVGDGEGRVVEANAAAHRLLQPASGEVVDDGSRELLPERMLDDDGHRVDPDDLPAQVARRTGAVVPERVLGLDGGDERWLAVSAFPVDTPDGRWVVTQLRDVTAETRTVVGLRRQAAVDPLTGVGNRRLLEWTVEDLVDPEEQVGVVLLDIDRFKAVNDVHGHAVGDQVLRQIAERIHAVCRPDDVAIRLGGDEFVLVLRRLEALADADVIVDRIAGALRAPFTTDAGLLDVGCSLGSTAGSALEAKRLVREADRLMYVTKSAGQQDPGLAEVLPAGMDRVRDRA
ncbi:GGDEF domain-containing protein [Acidimicrobiia bacterium EGI L10123]|uniref:diguanylate cyclase domain-containing protein n=1 Tax=Salinilacustrithrix flava TaxID=2957203 RepID=UPI003D7C341C|nr:GGDEF domain-containing protein [Acidimicrobiia bacterium EGI L10123]